MVWRVIIDHSHQDKFYYRQSGTTPSRELSLFSCLSCSSPFCHPTHPPVMSFFPRPVHPPQFLSLLPWADCISSRLPPSLSSRQSPVHLPSVPRAAADISATRASLSCLEVPVRAARGRASILPTAGAPLPAETASDGPQPANRPESGSPRNLFE